MYYKKLMALCVSMSVLVAAGTADAAKNKSTVPMNEKVVEKVLKSKNSPQMVRKDGPKGGVRIITGDAADKAGKQASASTSSSAAAASKPAKQQPQKQKSSLLVEKDGKSYFLGTELPADYKSISIYGEPEANRAQAAAYIKAANPNVRLACSVEELVNLYWQEAEREGVRPDLALAQSLVETGAYAYGGDVQHHQNNFCGLGTTGGGVRGASFKTPELGVRAHIQHLLAYTQKKRPQTEIVDPRYELAHNIRMERGVVDTWYGLNGTWAMGSLYCEKIMATYQKMLAIEAEEPKAEEKKDKEAKNTKQKSMRERVEELLKEK